ncbi:MCM2/3/5 family-domain-containing protein [Cladochytrium replicatum]|nr:MCM2/3/5 family-domain-containing protein [Cladochytrium replicatum]
MDDEMASRVIWGTTVNIDESVKAFRNFLKNFRKADALPAGIEPKPEELQPFYPNLLQMLKESQMLDMNLDCQNLFGFESSRNLYYQLIRYPQEIIPVMDHTLTEVFINTFEDVDLEGQAMRVRPFNLNRMVNLRQLDPSDIDQLVTVKGLLIRASTVIPDLKVGKCFCSFFRCHVCDHTLTVDVDRGRINEPTKCPRPDCNQKNSLLLVHNRCEFANKQIWRLQETPGIDETPDGETPHTVSMMVYDDLVDVAKPGDRLEITGIFRGVPVRVNPRKRTIKALFKTFIDVVHVKRSDRKRVAVDPSIRNENEFVVEFEEGDAAKKVNPVDEEAILELSQRPDLYELLARSIAPSIYGMEDVKKGVLLQLFGGANKFDGKSGSPKIRGDINVLLVGDPGVAKSQLLQYVNKLAPRGIYTSGKGSSAVGLTAYITRDPDSRQLVLESGALVLSDGGVCCIDEFDKMSDHTRAVLHEVMEQQTISVAKAGIITTLNARTSILASANPINSKFDTRLSMVHNINLPPSLISRFDLLYLVLDVPNERDDRRLAQHLVNLYLDETPQVSAEDYVPIELFAKYINFARTKIDPVISEDAGKALIDHFVNMRQMGSGGGQRVVSATTRQLESMIRLSEAHARMRLSEVVDKADVDEAHRLIVTALQTSAIDPRTGRIDLDLVNTGISASYRSARLKKRAGLKKLIEQRGGGNTPIMKSDLLREFRAAMQETISEEEFNVMLNDLADENLVTVAARTVTRI